MLFVLQVVLQVVISFIVEAFVLQLEQANQRKENDHKKRLLGRNRTLSDDTDCIEGTQCDHMHMYISATSVTDWPILHNFTLHTVFVSAFSHTPLTIFCKTFCSYYFR